MVAHDEGRGKMASLNCVTFSEVSVQEDMDDVMDIFDDMYMLCKKQRKFKFLGSSKLSLNQLEKTVEANSSSDQEDDQNEEKDLGDEKVVHGNDNVNVKVTPPSPLLNGNGSGSRRGTLFSTPPPERLQNGKNIRRSGSRRREAFLAFS